MAEKHRLWSSNSSREREIRPLTPTDWLDVAERATGHRPPANANRSRHPSHPTLRLRPIPSSFFNASTHTVARKLIGAILIHGKTAGMIVETEAYTGKNDPGSHASIGLRTRNAPMFEEPGKAYVYKCHMYPLLNVVTERHGSPGAVLLRALIPVRGLDLMRRRRLSGRKPSRLPDSLRLPDHDLCRGPGKLTAALGVSLSHNRADLIHGPLRLALPRHPMKFRITRTTRIGLHGPASKLPWRFTVVQCPFGSGSPITTQAR